MKTYLNIISVCTSITLIGCAHPYPSSSEGYTGGYTKSSTTARHEPKFVGWDKNGRIMYDGQKTQLDNTKEEILSPAPSQNPTKKVDKSKKATKKIQEVKNETIEKTILINEDAIVCENESNLNPSVMDIYTTEKKPYTATSLISVANTTITSYESKNRTAQAEQEYLNSISPRDNSSFTMLTRNYLKQEKDELSKSENSVNHAKDFLKSCTAIKEPQNVTLIESKPISNISKINIKMNGNYFPMWTYTNHLTIK